MRTLAFDTLEFAKKLKAANFPQDQAEALAEAVAGIVEERLATKQDLKELELRLEARSKELETRLRHDMKELENGLRHDMKELETGLRHDMKELETGLHRDLKEMELRLRHDLTLRLGAMLVAGVSLVAVLVKLL
ncbi:MAG: DUF1640 domain-containing protein [Deltaproteobacteria bacterium]|nr:DUF1640 domain-containing protein [Deltaproteobacteria bacterium]